MVRVARVASQIIDFILMGSPGVHTKTHRKQLLGPGLEEPRGHERWFDNYI